MIDTAQKSFAISPPDSLAFAELCGDFNPLHVDAVFARRTQFGGTVAHGIHVLLKAIDLAVEQRDMDTKEPASIAVTYSNPVRTDATVQITIRRDSATDKIRIVGESGGLNAFSATVDLAVRSDAATVAIPDALFPAAKPDVIAFPPSFSAGQVPLQLHRAQLQRMFPNLAGSQFHGQSHGWIADLLGTTQIVGMKCPGMDSIFSTCKLRRRTSMGDAVMPYKVDKVDARFKMIRLSVIGTVMEGTLEGFFRPPPVAQLTLQQVMQHVLPDQFRGARVLVVGGSRGLGELAAKIVLAGGGDAVITYAMGQSDAARLCDAAAHNGRSCVAKQLDAVQLAAGAIPDWLTDAPFTHVYYFASPYIAKGAAKGWNQEIFARFATVYVHAFANLILALARQPMPATSRLKVLYPSSIFVADIPEGFAEYAAAKSAGETLCKALAVEHKLTIHAPRLPRMKTDQTNSQIDVGALEPLPFILHALQTLHQMQ